MADLSIKHTEAQIEQAAALQAHLAGDRHRPCYHAAVLTASSDNRHDRTLRRADGMFFLQKVSAHHVIIT